MDEFARQAFGEWESTQIARRRGVWMHVIVWGSVNLLLFTIWAVTGAGFPWFIFPLLGWLIGLSAHAASVYVLRAPDDIVFEKEARRRKLER